MKQLYLIITLLAIVMLSSCKQEENIDPRLIPGKWKSGSVYYVFTSDGLGHTWDAADDVTEDEAQQYTWEVSVKTLTINHIGEMGEIIPKTYTIKTLTATTFMFNDDYGNVTTLNRIE